MAYIKIDSGELTAITIAPGDIGNSRSIYKYPSWSTQNIYWNTSIISVTTSVYYPTPSWSCEELGTEQVLFTLLDGVDVVFTQRFANATIGVADRWEINLVKNGETTRRLLYQDYSSVFSVIGIVFDPPLGGCYVGFAVCFDYSIGTDLSKQDRLENINNLLSSCLNNTLSSNYFIAQNGSGDNRTYIELSNIILDSTYYNGDDVNPDPPPPPSTDPYNGGGYSGSGGGPGAGGQSGTGGNYDTSSDAIPVPSLPSSISTGSGLFTAYNPSASQLANFASKLWNKDPTTIDDWFRMLFGGDAFNAIIGLTLIPVSPSTGSSKNILLGNWDTGASAPVITSQYAEVNFGSLTLSEFWGNSIDYSPYTRVQLALPYIGIVDVDTDDVIGSVNTLVYHIDVFSGAICAMLHCVKGNLSSVIYQWSGSCGVTLPITGQSFNAVIGAIMGVGAAALGGIAMASGPVGAAIGTAGSLAVGTGAVTGAAANMFGTMKGKVQKSGSFNASSGALGIMTPYFIITRPVQSIPSTQQATKGYPSNISAHLGDLSGYTEVTEVHLHNIPGTKDEVLEIESLLKKGVIF